MSARPRAAAPAALLLVLGLAPACRAAATEAPEVRASTPAPPAPIEADPSASAEPKPEPEPAPAYTPASDLGEPRGVREARRSRLVYAEPSNEAPLRGRIPNGETFAVYAEREAPGCKRAWAQVAPAAWVCLDKTSASEVAPAPLPHLDPGMIVPFIYARHPDHDKDGTPDIPVYASSRAAREGQPPSATLPAHGSYAFSKLRERGGHQLLTTLDRKVVIGDELELFEPSEFAGVELDAPLPEGQVLAWAVRWKTLIHAAPDPGAQTRGRIRYHDAAIVTGEIVEVEADEPADQAWIAVLAEGERRGGWVRVDDIRRFVPLAPPEPVLGGQVTLDVDLDEQVLSVWVEREPVFATLVSSGKLNDRTPPGLYRLSSKRAYGKMASRADARREYYVDAVPWAMYFHGRYALHASYWHDMFGHRMSHGCVNLSPRDAKRVFELSTPTLPPGWLVVEEHRQDPGTLVRIRRIGAELPDRRAPFD